MAARGVFPLTRLILYSCYVPWGLATHRMLYGRAPCCLAAEQQGSQVPETEMVKSLNIAKITKILLSTVANFEETTAVY